MIPARLIRTVAEHTDDATEALWAKACDLHPGWEHVTYRDPINPEWFPLTSKYWGRCKNGAQLAGLIRLEALLHAGGIYIDSDVDLVRPLTPLRPLSAFACYEDPGVIPDAVLGAEAGHDAIQACLRLALDRLASASTDWRTGNDPWATGPGVTTTVFPGRDDVLLLPPAAFYPVHYAPRDTLGHRLDTYRPEPWVFGVHRWAWSWR